MGFTQVSFLFFFMPVSIMLYLAAYKLSGKDLRVCNGVLIFEGLIFYWWTEPKLLLYFVALTVLLYCLGNRMHNAGDEKEKKEMMIITIVIFAVLPVLYKYLPAFRLPLGNGQFGVLPAFRTAMIPLGICFFALGAISYIADVYTGKMPLGSLMDVLEFMMLFPKAACGPVVLWRDFSPQIHTRETNLDKVSNGLKRIIIGYAKKAIVADTLAAQIALTDSKLLPGGTDVLSAWLLMLLYFFRIYYDFSGYSDIAIGLMETFGFDIEENFDRPYLSASMSDFWRRWHISLGKWFREYIYIPLGGNRKGNNKRNIIITFLIAGLWHGWRAPLLLWAIINGIIVAAEKTSCKIDRYRNLPKVIRIITTAVLVCMGWTLFRAPDITSAAALFKALVIPSGGSVPNFTVRFFLTKRTVVFTAIAAAGIFVPFRKIEGYLKSKMGQEAFDITEKIILLALFVISIMFILGTAYRPFIYASL